MQSNIMIYLRARRRLPPKAKHCRIIWTSSSCSKTKFNFSLCASWGIELDRVSLTVLETDNWTEEKPSQRVRFGSLKAGCHQKSPASVAAMASRKANSNMRVAQKYQSPKMHGHMHTLPNLAGRLVPPFLSQSPIACTNANSFNFFGLWMGDRLLEARFFQQWLSSWIPSRPEDIVVILGVFDMNGGWVWCVT